MLEDVLAAAGSAGVGSVLVATESDAVSRVAERGGAEVVHVAPAGMRAAAALALTAAADRRAGCALVLPADLPTIRSADVAALARAALRASVVLAPDRHRRGTNALALRPPLALAPLFGDRSFEAHREAARNAGLCLEVVDRAGLALDVDTADDLRAALADPTALGPSTARVAATLRLASLPTRADRAAGG